MVLGLTPSGAAIGLRARVLVVEDQAPIARLLELVLTGQGYEVRRVGDGRAALSLLASESWDLVLLDWQLPRLDAQAVLARLRADERTRALPAIVLSGWVRDGQSLPGASAVLAKPFSVAGLLALVFELTSGSVTAAAG